MFAFPARNILQLLILGILIQTCATVWCSGRSHRLLNKELQIPFPALPWDFSLKGIVLCMYELLLYVI